jgi:hypothetical protein
MCPQYNRGRSQKNTSAEGLIDRQASAVSLHRLLLLLFLHLVSVIAFVNIWTVVNFLVFVTCEMNQHR